MTKYIMRFDDLSRYSDIDKWKSVLEPFLSRGFPALVAVIPDCKDEKLMKRKPVSDSDFWTFVRTLKMFDIGMHGLHHEGFHLMVREQQESWMRESMKIFVRNRVIPNVFVPPNHGLNRHTLSAMRTVGMEFLSDGIGLYPWKDDDTDIMVVPQILWTPRGLPLPGIMTFCLHPDTMTKDQIEDLKKFVVTHVDSLMSISDVSPTPISLLNIPFVPIYRYLYNRKKYPKKR